jgi:nicotinate-nucleotide pyrophosphorylase (carboxylating)
MHLTMPDNKFFEQLFVEDQVGQNQFYQACLPRDIVRCELKIKDNMILSGLHYFFGAFNYLNPEIYLTNKKQWSELFFQYEGKSLQKNDGVILYFDLPFNTALNGERIALNLLQRSSSISTFTEKFARPAKELGIKILDTRKTTPGLRDLEKYGVRLGGGYNHRFSQTDLWMIKDNHKSFFGGVKEAVRFFENMNSMYKEIELEIHSLGELEEGLRLGIRHFMLDNFSTQEIKEAIKVKKNDITYEVSGGVKLDSLNEYLIPGVDAISVGSLTYGAPSVDISLKYNR